MILTVLRAGSSFPRLSSAVILLESEGLRLLVDTGDADDGDRLCEALGQRGIGPSDVDAIVSTHLHYDHCGNHLRFPRARYLVSREDVEDVATFMRTYHADRSPDKAAAASLLRSRYDAIQTYYVRSIVREVVRNQTFYDRVLAADRAFELVSGGTWLTGEVELVATPGHTRGHLSVVAHGVGRPGSAASDVLIAGDALSAREVLGGPADIDPPLVADRATYRHTRRRLLDRYRYIVPGHGPLVDTRICLEASRL